MKRHWSLTTAALVALAALGTVSACTQRNGDINRIVDPYWSKSDFDPNSHWYYRATTIDTHPGASGWTGSVGDGHWLQLERLRWEVTETMLIGYRDFATTPGTEKDQWEGADDVYQGNAVAMFPITDHFDVRRTYDGFTGEETNVIMENRERAWYDREYFRVDWGTNMVPTSNWQIMVEQVSQSWAPQSGQDKGDPKRWRFEYDESDKLEYFEYVSRSNFMPDLFSASGWNGPGYAGDLATYTLDLRHSFLRFDPDEAADFEAMHNPATVILEDEDGNEVRDEDGFADRVPLNDRFGYFGNFGRLYWDPDRGLTDAGANYKAAIFDIWEQTVASDGSYIPVEERDPKPIVYYTNVTHPKKLLDASIERVGGGWDEAFLDVAFYAQTVDVENPRWQSRDDLIAFLDDTYQNGGKMFEVRENDCNPSNVQEVLSGLPLHIQTQVRNAAAKPPEEVPGFTGEIEDVVERYDWANSDEARSESPFHVRTVTETQALEDLERICTAMEYYTDPKISRDDSLEHFKYQRIGDIRYNMFNLIMHDVNAGWLGLGPMHADPVTGKNIVSTANIAVALLDRSVESINQRIDAINGLIPQGDLIAGTDVRRYMMQKLEEVNLFRQTDLSDEMAESMRNRVEGWRHNGNSDEEGLKEVSPAQVQARLDRIKGTPIESQLIHPEDALLYGVASDPTSMTNDFSEDVLEQLSPVRGLQDRKIKAREAYIREMGNRAVDMPEYFDSFALGLALRLKDEPDREKRKDMIREQLYTAVQLHEVGHNVGLMHNFAASTDALNYGERFWQLQSYPADKNAALSSGDVPDADKAVVEACIFEEDAINDREGTELEYTTQECLGEAQHMYSSIMDYHGHWNGDFGGLGHYDRAAVKFMYGKLVETFKPENLVADPATTDIERWTYLNNWRDIPSQVVNNYAAVNDRDHVKWEWNNVTSREPWPELAVPYRFCWGGYFTPWCRTGDHGPDMKTNTSMKLMQYWSDYFFTHYNRGKLWEFADAFGGVGRDEGLLFDFTEKMRWYSFMSLTDPEFAGSYAEEDFLAVTLRGLNHFGHVLGHPPSGDFTTVPRYQADWAFNDEPGTYDRLAPTNIASPWEYRGQCSAIHIAETDNDGRPIAGNPGYRVGYVPLSEGRPFFLGWTEDYEEWFMRYVGSYYSKTDALWWLGNSLAWFPYTNFAVDPRYFEISWFRLFPDQVSKLVHAIVTEQDHTIGPLLDPDGNYVRRDLVDMNASIEQGSLMEPDYSDHAMILPSISVNHQFLAMAWAHTWMSSQFDDQTDFAKSFKVAVEGSIDDVGFFDYFDDQGETDRYIDFVHPQSGERLRALKAGNYPVAYDLLKRAQVMKARWERLQACADDPMGTLAQTDEYCACVQTVEERPNGRFCADPYLEPPGTGECPVYDLERRAESARERMDDMVDFIDTVRMYNYYLSGQ